MLKKLLATLLIALLMTACGAPPAAPAMPAPAVQQATTMLLVGTLAEPIEFGSMALFPQYVVPITIITAGATIAGAAQAENTANCMSGGGEPYLFANPDPRAGMPMQVGCKPWTQVQAECTQKLGLAEQKLAQFQVNDLSKGTRLYKTYTDASGKLVAEVEYEVMGGHIVGVPDQYVATNYVKVHDDNLKQGGVATFLLVQAAQAYPAWLQSQGVSTSGMKLLFIDINGLSYSCYWNALIGKAKADKYLTVQGKNGPEQVPYSEFK